MYIFIAQAQRSLSSRYCRGCLGSFLLVCCGGLLGFQKRGSTEHFLVIQRGQLLQESVDRLHYTRGCQQKELMAEHKTYRFRICMEFAWKSAASWWFQWWGRVSWSWSSFRYCQGFHLQWTPSLSSALHCYCLNSKGQNKENLQEEDCAYRYGRHGNEAAARDFR